MPPVLIPNENDICSTSSELPQQCRTRTTANANRAGKEQKCDIILQKANWLKKHLNRETKSFWESIKLLKKIEKGTEKTSSDKTSYDAEGERNQVCSTEETVFLQYLLNFTN